MPKWQYNPFSGKLDSVFSVFWIPILAYDLSIGRLENGYGRGSVKKSFKAF